MADADLELRANRMDIVTHWADDVAHEIKNPIHAMVINLELVKRRAGAADPEPLIERARIVEAELHRVHSLIESLLQMVRPWEERPRAEVDRIFAALLPVLEARTRARKIDYRHRPGGAIVPMGPGLVSLVLLNLIDNAIIATPEGGAIETACVSSDDTIRITVLDTGTGVPAELADRMYEAGVTDRPGHAGLGLAIARRLVSRAGGHIEIQPAPGEAGTLVTIDLPRVGAA